MIDAASNSVVYDETRGFMYCKSDNAQAMNAGIKLLSNQTPKNYALAQVDGGDGIIDITDGLLDIEKFHMISNNTGAINQSNDMVVYSGAGPFNIAAGDTVVVGFAIIAAPSIFTVNEAIENASNLYTDIKHPQNINNQLCKIVCVSKSALNQIILKYLYINRNAELKNYSITGETFCI